VNPRFAIRSAHRHNAETIELVVDAPLVAEHARAGQFVIVRTTINGERIPLTICEADPDTGTISLVVQAVGRSTTEMQTLEPGDRLADLLGPLGEPTDIDDFGTCAVVAGGVGVAIGMPVARALSAAGNSVIGIVGARSAEQIVLIDRFTDACDVVHICTEDGSMGILGMVTDALESILGEHRIDRVFVVGPIPMMAAVAEMTRSHSVPTIASLNPIMVDGTGMCGGCRVRVGGVARFACVDGPDFDAHLVDFPALATRNTAYRAFEVCQAARMVRSDG
jgi:ferredoxin--NADP+ reductase